MQGPLEGTVTDAFEGLPLEEGLRRLLRDVDFIFLYVEKGSVNKLSEVRILPGQGGSIAETAQTRHQLSQETEDVFVGRGQVFG
jgi:hypothetical protein